MLENKITGLMKSVRVVARLLSKAMRGSRENKNAMAGAPMANYAKRP